MNGTLDSFGALLAQLDREKVPYQAIPGQPAVTLPTRLGAEEGVLHIRWGATPGVVHFIQPLPLQVPEKRRTAALQALGQLNHRLAVLGFVLNPDTGAIAFRTQAFLGPRRELPTGLVGALIATCARTASDNLETLRLTTSGLTSQAATGVAL